MKKRLICLSLCLILALAAVPLKGAYAYTATFTPPDIDIDADGKPDMDDLDHWKYYTWGIFSSIPNGEQIISATLFIDNITNWDNYANILYIHLLDTNFNGVNYAYDNQGGGNAFDGQGLQIATYSDTNGVGTTDDLIYHFNNEQLAALNSYASDNKFGFGFDPDCHYWNDGISFNNYHHPRAGEYDFIRHWRAGIGCA